MRTIPPCRSNLVLVASMTALLAFTAAARGADSPSSSTQSSIPAAGDAIKKSDIIIWQENVPITMAGSATNSSTKTGTSGPTAPTDATDAAAVAGAIQGAAQKALLRAAEDATQPAPAANATLNLRAARSAADEAATLATKAKVASTPNPPIAASTVAKAQDAVIQAHADVESAWSKLEQTQAAYLAKKKLADQAPTSKVAQKDAADAATAQTDAQATLAASQAFLADASAGLDTLTAQVKAAADSLAKQPAQVTGSVYCFPKGSRFDVTGVDAATAAPADQSSSGATAGSNKSTVTLANTQLVSGHFSGSWVGKILHPWHRNPTGTGAGKLLLTPNEDQPGASVCDNGDQKYLVPTLDAPYSFSGDQLSQLKSPASGTPDYKRLGFTWGGLVVPYKFYFSDKSIKSNSSIVGFAGYEGWFPGVSLAAVIAAGGGAATANTNSSNSGSPASGAAANSSASSPSGSITAVTYTVGLGIIATFAGSVKAGLMFGRDYQGNPSQFPYENKTWMALSIGAGF